MAQTPKPVRRKNKARKRALKTVGYYHEDVGVNKLIVDGEVYTFGNLTTFSPTFWERDKEST